MSTRGWPKESSSFSVAEKALQHCTACFRRSMKVSVAMITYNHERFLAQAIDSVLAQKTDFEFEIVIGEDCSTDGTRRILLEYQDKSGGRIRPILHDVNQGMNRNLEQTLLACRGEYIALLEGDDYWTSDDKLAMQADFLDRHPECSMCFHNALVVYEDGSRPASQYCAPEQPAYSDIEDILKVNFIPTCSVMFRGLAVREFPEWLRRLNVGDWPLNVFYAEQGRIGYLEDTMAAYRLHPGGSYSMRSAIDQHQTILSMYDQLDSHLGFRYSALIKSAVFDRWYALAILFTRSGRLRDARHYSALCLRTRPLTFKLLSKLKIAARTFIPVVHRLAESTANIRSR